MQPDNRSTRRTAHQIANNAMRTAEDEMSRTSLALAFSALAAGLSLGLTALAISLVQAYLGSEGPALILAAAVFPIGFVAVIIGRAQLFTENTLYPVLITLMEPRRIWQMLRLWAVVFVFNMLGAVLFALLAARTGALKPEFQNALISLGKEAVAHSASDVFWGGVVAGWLIALIAWLVTASHWTSGQILVIWAIAFLMGLGQFPHCIASSCEIITAALLGVTSVPDYLRWLAAATGGNIVGGVVVVTLLNYGQVRPDQKKSPDEREQRAA